MCEIIKEHEENGKEEKEEKEKEKDVVLRELIRIACVASGMGFLMMLLGGIIVWNHEPAIEYTVEVVTYMLCSLAIKLIFAGVAFAAL